MATEKVRSRVWLKDNKGGDSFILNPNLSALSRKSNPRDFWALLISLLPFPSSGVYRETFVTWERPVSGMEENVTFIPERPCVADRTDSVKPKG